MPFIILALEQGCSSFDNHLKMSYGDIDLSQTPEGLSEQQQQAIADFKKDIWKLPDGTTYEPAPVEEYLKWDWTAWSASATSTSLSLV